MKIIGDFNVPDLNNQNIISQFQSDFNDLISLLNLEQLNQTRNINDKILDLVIY